jgi:hypothetical protein
MVSSQKQKDLSFRYTLAGIRVLTSKYTGVVGLCFVILWRGNRKIRFYLPQLGSVNIDEFILKQKISGLF